MTCEAAVYSEQTNTLILAMQPVDKSQDPTFCYFDMDKVDAEFDNTWAECQKEERKSLKENYAVYAAGFFPFFSK